MMVRKKRKLSKKARAAALRNLAKARRGRTSRKRRTTKPRRVKGMARRRYRKKKRGRKRGMPSVANMVALAAAMNELGVINAIQQAIGPNKSIVDAVNSLAQTDPMNVIDAIIPFAIFRIARKFIGPVRAGPVTIL